MVGQALRCSGGGLWARRLPEVSAGLRTMRENPTMFHQEAGRAEPCDAWPSQRCETCCLEHRWSSDPRVPWWDGSTPPVNYATHASALRVLFARCPLVGVEARERRRCRRVTELRSPAVPPSRGRARLPPTPAPPALLPTNTSRPPSPGGGRRRPDGPPLPAPRRRARPRPRT